MTKSDDDYAAALDGPADEKHLKAFDQARAGDPAPESANDARARMARQRRSPDTGI